MPIENYHPRERDLDIMAHVDERELREIGEKRVFHAYDDTISTPNRYFTILLEQKGPGFANAFAVGEYIMKGWTELAQSYLKQLLERS